MAYECYVEIIDLDLDFSDTFGLKKDYCKGKAKAFHFKRRRSSLPKDTKSQTGFKLNEIDFLVPLSF